MAVTARLGLESPSSFNSRSVTKHVFTVMTDHEDVSSDYLNRSAVSLFILSSAT
jgi:hypothetical protein